MPRTTLTAVERAWRERKRLREQAAKEAERLASRGPYAVAASVQTYQAQALLGSAAALNAILAEQAISAAAEATPQPQSLLSGVVELAQLLARTDSVPALSRLVETMVTDAARTMRAVDMATRPAVTGYVRYLVGPSCGRCVVLAGRVYRYSTGFRRHPQCNCEMCPVSDDLDPNLITDPDQAIREGLVTDLTKADAEALEAGADLGRVVNVRSRRAGLVVGSSVMTRAGRLTPAGCLAAETRSEQLALLAANGYIL